MHSLTNSCHYCANKLIQNNSYRGNSSKEKIVCEKFSSSFVHKASQLIFHNNVPALSNSPNSCIYQVIESHFQIIVFHLRWNIVEQRSPLPFFLCSHYFCSPDCCCYVKEISLRDEPLQFFYASMLFTFQRIIAKADRQKTVKKHN